MGDETPIWTETVANIQDAGLKDTLSKFESQQKFFETIGYKPPEKIEANWREQIKEDELKKFAEESTDVNHLVKRALDMRKTLSNAIIRPGKEAKPEQIAAYRKSMGIPETPDKYDFPDKGIELTDEIRAERKEWSERFYKLGVPNEQAKALWEMVAADNLKTANDTIDADKAYAKAQDDKLKSEWKGDYDKNKTMGIRAFKQLAEKAGLNIEELTKIETKDGRFLMDNADIVHIFAIIGREMAEGTLGSTLTDSERDTIDEQVAAIRKQVSEAQGRGDSKKSNELYAKELALIARRDGNQPLVGSGGRSV